MTSGVLFQMLLDLVLFSMLGFLWVKVMRPQKDDPRLSRGLQLLQSKIAVLEDLSDQVEKQFHQMNALLESKAREVQAQLHNSDQKLREIESATNKSLQVAEIFQDRIPHQEIVERQNTIKYVKAAKMAHEGASVEEILEAVDLSRGEIEMIANVNRDQLQFSEEDLPEWINTDSGSGGVSKSRDSQPQQALTRVEDRPIIALSELGDRFRNAVGITPQTPEAGTISGTPPPRAPQIEMPSSETKSMTSRALSSSSPLMIQKEFARNSQGKSVEIQKVVFPRVDVTQHLS